MIKISGLINNNILLKETKQGVLFVSFQMEVTSKNSQELPSGKIFFTAFKDLAKRLSRYSKGQRLVLEGQIKTFSINKYSFSVSKILYPSDYFSDLDAQLKSFGIKN